MRGRVAWYGLMQWALSDTLQPVGKVVLAIDRTAYILAFLLGAVGWTYVSSRRFSPRFHAGCRAQLKRGLLLDGPILTTMEYCEIHNNAN